MDSRLRGKDNDIRGKYNDIFVMYRGIYLLQIMLKGKNRLAGVSQETPARRGRYQLFEGESCACPCLNCPKTRIRDI